MDATFTPEQQELRRAVRDVAADHAAGLRVAIDSPEGYTRPLWQLLAGELGLVAIALPEELGGLGGSFVDVSVALEEAGRALLPVPLLSSVVGALAVGGAAARHPDLVDRVSALAAGDTTATLVVAPALSGGTGRLTGRVDNVLDGRLADLFVVAAADGLFLVDAGADGLTVTATRSLDLARRQAVVSFDDVALHSAGSADDGARAVDLLRVALAVESVGVGRRCLELTTDYLKTREQFGRPIGSFQALQHRAADLVVALESAASAAAYAAWAAAASPAELPVLAPLALSVCGDAAYRVAAETIQLHGGIGFTWEHDAHLYFKRAAVNRLLLGGSHEQRRLVASRAGLAAAAGPLSASGSAGP